jgi:Putative MetA-pathway of phenol degradation
MKQICCGPCYSDQMIKECIHHGRATCGMFWGACVILAILAPPALRAGPPFVTDDPEPVELHHWEVYLASLSAQGDGGITGTAPHLEVNYGALPEVQLHVIAPLAYAKTGGGPWNSGFGDAELGFKVRFLDETGSRPQIGTFPLVELPTGDEARGLGGGHTRAFIPLWLQKSIGPWTTYGGGGYWLNPGGGNRNYWLFGWEVQRALLDSFAVGVEFFRATSSIVGGDPAFSFNVGTILDLSEKHHILFSVGRDFQGPNRFTAYLAFQWTLGPH